MARKTVRKCYCAETGDRGAPHAPHGRARTLKGVAALLDDLESLRDGTDEGIGMLLRRAKEQIERDQFTQKVLRTALDNLLAAHDAQPSMLTAAEWDQARAALGAGRSTQEELVVLTMESDSRTWLAVGRTLDEAKQALAKKWDSEAVPRGSSKWKDIKSGDDGDAFAYYGGWTWRVRLGRAYVDGFDESA